MEWYNQWKVRLYISVQLNKFEERTIAFWSLILFILKCSSIIHSSSPFPLNPHHLPPKKKKSQAAPPLLTQSSDTPITEGFWENQSSRTKLCKSAPWRTQYVITLTAEPAMQGAKDKASSHCTNLPRSTTVLRVAWQACVLHDCV